MAGKKKRAAGVTSKQLPLVPQPKWLGMKSPGGHSITYNELDAMSPRRAAAIRRAIRLTRVFEKALGSLCDMTVNDEANRDAMDWIAGIWPAAHGHEATFVFTMELISAVRWVASTDAEPDEKHAADAVCHLLETSGYSDIVARLDGAIVARTILAWREPKRGGGKWKAVAELVSAAGLGTQTPGTLSRQFAAWRAEVGEVGQDQG